MNAMNARKSLNILNNARIRIRIPCRHENDLQVGTTVSVLDGKPLVDVYDGNQVELNFTPNEAEALGMALIRAAEDARKIVKE